MPPEIAPMPPENAPMPKSSESAPWYPIPKKQAVSVEHPFLVKNVDKAIETLGGDEAIKAFLGPDHAEKPINLKFHPDDPFTPPTLSLNCQTNNILLRVIVPKRTGRKRKRGSNDAFVEDLEEAPSKKSARYLVQSLRDNRATYQLEPVAFVPTVHIFRTMPDFVYSTANSRFLNQFREKILPLQYPLLSEFQLSPARGLEDSEIIPPPFFSAIAYPQNYAYRQNPAVKAFIDPETGLRRLFNTQAPTKNFTQQCHWDTLPSTIPSTVSPQASALESHPHNFRGLVTILQTIFARRPIWTRRGLANQLPPNAPIFLAKYAIGYVAYAMRSGPWRDCYIRLGLDPRSSPSYRKYQTLMLQLVSPKKSRVENKKYDDIALRYWRRDPETSSHIFTGRGRVPHDGKCWQLCDLTDPLLKSLVDTPDLGIRSECEDRYFGWYQNGTWCKLKIILRAKIDVLMEGGTPDELFDLKFDRLLKLPETYNVSITPAKQGPDDGLRHEGPSLWKAAGREGDPLLGFLPRNATKLELEWAAQYRSLCRAPQGKLPHSGRLSKSKKAVRDSFVGERREDTEGRGGEEGTLTESESREGNGAEGQADLLGGDGEDEVEEELELEAEEEDEGGLDVDVDVDDEDGVEGEGGEEGEEGSEMDEDMHHETALPAYDTT